MEKYYKPEIEEFHVGFEYEICNPDTGLFGKCIFKDGESAENLVQEDYGEIRVKYLDKEDIESLGLLHIGGRLDGKTNQQYIIKVRKGYYLHLTLTHFSFGSVITIYTSVYENSEKTLIVHTIRIKNKCEFKKLLKQLNTL